jgi:hypothetical protein
MDTPQSPKPLRSAVPLCPICRAEMVIDRRGVHGIIYTCVPCRVTVHDSAESEGDDR